MSSEFYECSNVPPCTYGVGGSKRVAAEYGGQMYFVCKSASHSWHPHGPLHWYVSRAGLCEYHRCEQLHAQGQPAEAPPIPASGQGWPGATPEELALRSRYDQQEN
jgi:hypothetical protein